MFKKVLILCTGNICRSPAAEWLMKNKLAAMEGRISVESAGLSAPVGCSIAPEMQELLLRKGINAVSHRARQVTNDMILNADLILIMENIQKMHLERSFPIAKGKTFLLGKWDNKEILDPYRQPLDVFTEVFSLIEQSIQEWYERVWENENNQQNLQYYEVI